MAEYTITDPKGIRIKSLLLSDIQGMHTLLKKEGCIDSENISPTELKSKLSSSKSLVLSDDYTYANAFYVLFKQSVLTPTQYNRLKRQFAGKPQFRFMNAIDFWKLFD
jgi:hypothetical protein